MITTGVFAGGWVLLVIIRARLGCGSSGPGTTTATAGGSGDQGKDPFSRAMAGVDLPTQEQLNGITTVAHAGGA